jgi:hypothetical protein
MTLNERAHDKIYAKINALEWEIYDYQKDIDDGTATRFIPMSLHNSVLKSRKREKELYEYILKLILDEHKKRNNGNQPISS